MRGLLVTAVGGGVLWGIWVLLWRSTSLPVLVSGFWCVLLVGGLVGWRKAGQGFKAGVWYRLDLWGLFTALFLLGVARGVVRTAGAILRGRTDPGIIAVPLEVESDLSRLLLILAITASPGTIAILAEREILYVHCLRVPRGPHLPEVGAMQRILRALAG